MIRTKEDLRRYLKQDAAGYPVQTTSLTRRLKWNLYSDPGSDTKYIWLYVKTLRLLEYHINNKNRLGMIYYSWRLRRLGYKTGFQIPPNVCGAGLRVFHYGSIIINDKTFIGSDATLYPEVLIGHKTPGQPAPTIGNNVFIGSGAKVIGDIHIGNNVTIAPNAVVVSNVPDNVVVGGIPSKILKYKK